MSEGSNCRVKTVDFISYSWGSYYVLVRFRQSQQGFGVFACETALT